MSGTIGGNRTAYPHPALYRIATHPPDDVHERDTVKVLVVPDVMMSADETETGRATITEPLSREALETLHWLHGECL